MNNENANVLYRTYIKEYLNGEQIYCCGYLLFSGLKYGVPQYKEEYIKSFDEAVKFAQDNIGRIALNYRLSLFKHVPILFGETDKWIKKVTKNEFVDYKYVIDITVLNENHFSIVKLAKNLSSNEFLTWCKEHQVSLVREEITNADN